MERLLKKLLTWVSPSTNGSRSSRPIPTTDDYTPIIDDHAETILQRERERNELIKRNKEAAERLPEGDYVAEIIAMEPFESRSGNPAKTGLRIILQYQDIKLFASMVGYPPIVNMVLATKHLYIGGDVLVVIRHRYYHEYMMYDTNVIWETLDVVS